MSKKAKEQLPNLVTALRIVFSTVLFFIPIKNAAFFSAHGMSVRAENAKEAVCAALHFLPLEHVPAN